MSGKKSATARIMERQQFDRRVTLQRPGPAVQDAFGQAAPAWIDVATVWAQVQVVRGQEYLAAAQIQAAQMVKVRILYRTDVLTTWRLIWQARPHDVNGLIPVGRNDVLEIMCMQGVNDGR